MPRPAQSQNTAPVAGNPFVSISHSQAGPANPRAGPPVHGRFQPNKKQIDTSIHLIYSVRKINEGPVNATGQILTLLRDSGPASRADLVRATGLSSAGLTKIAASLMQQGILDERQVDNHSGPGRPPVALSLRSDARYVIGIHLSAGRTRVVIADVLLNVVAEDGFTFDLNMPVEALVDRTAQIATQLIDTSRLPRNRLIGIGVGLPGGVDRARRVNIHSSFTNWTNVPFAALFEERLGLPAILEHNATAIALAETQYGRNRSSARTLHVFMGRGIGAGLAQGAHSTERGAARGPVEIGHIVLDPEGPPCRCGGLGCLETYFSEQPILQCIGLDAVPPEGLIARAMESEAWPDLYQRFLQALSTAVTLLSPDSVGLGGHLHSAPEQLLTDLRRDLPRRVMPQQREGLTINRTGLDKPIGARGAACIGLEAFFYRTGPAPLLSTAHMEPA
ncbi:MAG: ROK family protein [Nitratireductor rhodophyticola]|uniref:ROK family transcriptional regulator n=1 Tax=Nitratireductor rhodophyticola TaxID=2854036 RepID=UPI0032D948CE